MLKVYWIYMIIVIWLFPYFFIWVVDALWMMIKFYYGFSWLLFFFIVCELTLIDFMKAFSWTNIFTCPYSISETRFLFLKIWFFKKLKLPLILVYFFLKKENKKRKKNLCDSFFGKDMVVNFESEFGDQVTY